MRDAILIRDLEVQAVIGVSPEERKRCQTLILNLEMMTDFDAANRSDDLHDSVDYSVVEDAVLRLVEASSFFLLERMAGAVCDAVLAFDGIDEVTVTVDKPGAPRHSRSIAVRMNRRKSV